MKNLLCFAVLCLCTCSLAAQIRYVTPTGTGNGTSWANASSDLQAMINASANGEQVWVAKGTYKPTVATDPSDPRTKSFVMKEGVEIYGGLTINATTLDNRDFTANGSVLSGDIDNSPGNIAGNSYHVIYNRQNSLTAAALLDGFTVIGGNANASFPHNAGGGMYNIVTSPTVNNCTFSANRCNDEGGGIYNFDVTSTVNNCRFTANEAISGGGMFNSSSQITVIKCCFTANIANAGGGLYTEYSTDEMINCSFLGNRAREGGGMYNFAITSPRLANCSFSGNRAVVAGGAVRNIGFQEYLDFLGITVTSAYDVTFNNCVIFENQEDGSTSTVGASVSSNGIGSTTYMSSLIQNITDGTGTNLDGSLDPLFVDPPNPAAAPIMAGDLRLQVCSPAINAGDNNANNTTEDLAGNPRFYAGGIIDLGAYEYQGENVSTAPATPNTTVTWTGTASTYWQNGCNWEGRGIPGASNPMTIPDGTPNAPELQPNTTYAAQDLTLQPGVQLTLPAGSTFDISGTLLLDGGTLTNEGTLDPGATTLQNGGALTNRGRVE